jgi:hypothetical protein
MIRTIQIYTIPACGESNIDHDASRTWFLWEGECFVGAGKNVLEASIGKLAELFRLGFCSVGGVACTQSHQP